MRFFLEDLKKAFISFHVHLAKRHSYPTNTRDFENAMKELDGNFIHTEQKAGWQTSILTARFHNPSIKDFLVNWLVGNTSLVFEICEAAVFFRQLGTLWWVNSYTPNRNKNLASVQEILAKHPDKLIYHFERLISSADCGVSNFVFVDKPQMYIRKEEFSLVARLSYVLDVTKKLYIEGASHKFSQFFERCYGTKLLEEFENNPDKEWLADFLAKLNNHRIAKADETASERNKGFVNLGSAVVSDA